MIFTMIYCTWPFFEQLVFTPIGTGYAVDNLQLKLRSGTTLSFGSQQLRESLCIIHHLPTGGISPCPQVLEVTSSTNSSWGRRRMNCEKFKLTQRIVARFLSIFSCCDLISSICLIYEAYQVIICLCLIRLSLSFLSIFPTYSNLSCLSLPYLFWSNLLWSYPFSLVLSNIIWLSGCLSVCLSVCPSFFHSFFLSTRRYMYVVHSMHIRGSTTTVPPLKWGSFHGRKSVLLLTCRWGRMKGLQRSCKRYLSCQQKRDTVQSKKWHRRTFWWFFTLRIVMVVFYFSTI